ncbi:uncharacterized protein LOC144711417 [Wolffia australiana]
MEIFRRIASSSTSVPVAAFDSSSVLQNYPLLSALAAFLLAQVSKFFITRFRERRWDPKQLIGTGGMPSSHSATVAALAVSVGLRDGVSGSIFATAAILACIVMHDAFGVRLHAGRQAEVLNQIVYELPVEHPLANSRPLHELLGHTPLQVVAGLVLGSIIAIFAYLIGNIGS